MVAALRREALDKAGRSWHIAGAGFPS